MGRSPQRCTLALRTGIGVVAGLAAAGVFASCSAPDAPPDAPVDASLDAGAGTDAPPPADGAAPAPSLVAIHPAEVAFGSSFVLRVDALGLLPGARVLVDGVPVAPRAEEPGLGADAALEDGARSLYVSVRHTDVLASGALPIRIENAEGDLASRSEPVYLTVTPPAETPKIVDFSPDFGEPGDVVRVLGHFLPATLTLSDERGAEVRAEFDGLVVWGSEGGVEFAVFTVPPGWTSGQITIKANGAPPVRGPVFRVSRNAALGADVRASSSIQDPPRPPARAVDGLLSQSWFTQEYDCVDDPDCTGTPQLTVTLPQAVRIEHLAIRGNREYRGGFDFLRGRVEIVGSDGAVAFRRPTRHLLPNRDVEVDVPGVIGKTVRFVSEGDESVNPGLAELEIFEE